MNFLLDTHVALWAVTNNPRLPQSARTYIEGPKVAVWVSAASVWEISIKHALGQSRANAMPISGEAACAAFKGTDFGILAITGEHAACAGALPRHHGDPFDRMLVAQAMTDSLVLITHDQVLATYHPGVIVV